MFIRVILTMALVVPLVAHAEDMFKWRDARGRIHYSNDPEKTPPGAQVVTKRLGEIGGEPIGEVIAPAPQPRGEAPYVEPQARNAWTTTSSHPCLAEQGLGLLPNRAIDFDRRDWFSVDIACGPQHDIEGWLRRASTVLAYRVIGLN